jgi:hypothetical protein
MRVVFKRSLNVEEGNRRFRKGSVAWAELDGLRYRVIDPKDGASCIVSADDVRPVEFTRPPFGFMANRDGADFPLSPDSVERSVEEFLDQLSRSLAVDEYSPTLSGSVNALVFGEWGHGKSQVLYRCARRVQDKFPSALVIQVIPEELSPRGILGAVLSDLGRSLHSDQLQNLEAAYDEVDRVTDDHDAEEHVAQVLADFAEQIDALHSCLLFDEGQTWGRMNFQRFLEALSKKFRGNRRMLHTLQCHSMASLDRAREIARDLHKVLDAAVQIHLPSIQENEAGAFFRDRIAACTKDPDLPKSLIADGVAKALCRAAGGNPRRMLQYAGSVLEECDQRRLPVFNGDAVLKVFTDQNDPRTGHPLFYRQAFDRVVQLLPQVHPIQGEALAKFLVQNIGRLLGENWRARPMDLAQTLGGLNANETQRTATSHVDGISLLVARTEYNDEEDEDETFYFLSDEFHDRLAARTGSSGDLERKQALYRILLNPAESQADANNGLAVILHLERFGQNPIPRVLGERFQGMVFRVPVSGIPNGVPVLVTCLYNTEPPEDFLGAIVDGLTQRDWVRAIVVFHGNEHWHKYCGRPPAKALLKKLARSHPDALGIVAPVDTSHWQRILPPIESTNDEKTAVTAARVFASMVAEARTKDIPTDEERRRYFSEIAGILADARPTAYEIVYLPNERERTLLDADMWFGEQKDPGFLVREISEFASYKISKNDLDSLLGDHLEISPAGKARWVRAAPERSRLREAVLRGLQRRSKASDVVALSKHVQQHLLVEPLDRLEGNVTWVLRQLQRSGLAHHEDLTGNYSYVDLPGDKKTLEKELRGLLKAELNRNRAIQRFSADFAGPTAARLTDLANREQSLAGDLAAVVEGLRVIRQELTKVSEQQGDVEKRIAQEKEALLNDATSVLAKLENRATDIAPPWRELVIPEYRLCDFKNRLEDLRQRAASKDADLHYILNDERTAFVQQVERLAEKLKAPTARSADKPNATELLARWIASGTPFRSISVRVEVTE